VAARSGATCATESQRSCPAGWTIREFGLCEAAALDIRPRRYLPSRHAVLEVCDGRFKWFVKVVRPSAVADLCHRHDIARRDLPVPPVLAATPDGVIVLPEAKGTPLQTLIIDGGAALPSPEALESVLNALPAELMTLTPEPSHLQMVDYYAGVLRCIAADEPTVLTNLAEVVRGLQSVEVQTEQAVPVHGDFHEGQLFADDGQVTAVLDIDTAGPGNDPTTGRRCSRTCGLWLSTRQAENGPSATQTRSFPTPSGRLRLSSYDSGRLRHC
jgi:Phosphotransferase enzyme family